MAPVLAPTSVIPQRRWVAWIIFLLVLAGYAAYCTMVVILVLEKNNNPPASVRMSDENPTLPNVYICISTKFDVATPHAACYINPSSIVGNQSDLDVLKQRKTQPNRIVPDGFRWPTRVQNFSTGGNCPISFSPSFSGLGNDTGCFRYELYPLIGKRGMNMGGQSAAELVLSFNEDETQITADDLQLFADVCHVYLVYEAVNKSDVNGDGSAVGGRNSGGGSSISDPSPNSAPGSSSPMLLPPPNASETVAPSPPAPSAPRITPSSSPTPPAAPRSQPSRINGTTGRRRILTVSERDGSDEIERSLFLREEIRLSSEEEERRLPHRKIGPTVPMPRTAAHTWRAEGGTRRILQATQPTTPSTDMAFPAGLTTASHHRVEDFQVVGSFFAPVNMFSVYSMSLTKNDIKSRVSYEFSGSMSSSLLKGNMTILAEVLQPANQAKFLVVSLVMEDQGVRYVTEDDHIDALTVLNVIGQWGGFWQFALLVLGIFFVSIERQAPRLTVLDPKMLMDGLCPACFTEWMRSLCMRKRGGSKYNSSKLQATNLWDDDSAPR